LQFLPASWSDFPIIFHLSNLTENKSMDKIFKTFYQNVYIFAKIEKHVMPKGCQTDEQQ